MSVLSCYRQQILTRILVAAGVNLQSWQRATCSVPASVATLVFQLEEMQQ